MRLKIRRRLSDNEQKAIGIITLIVLPILIVLYIAKGLAYLVDVIWGSGGKADAPRGSVPLLPDGKLAISGAMDIGYIDSKGDKTERYIEAKSLEVREGRLYLWGWCEIRQGVRKFRVDRITALTDGETGEDVEPEQIVSWLRERAGIDRAVAA
ncbi:MAG: WYL domain-containing protein [Pseudomonadota bacterium]|nr:WYL domain-containing protein [Pseudomonadota bacterium]